MWKDDSVLPAGWVSILAAVGIIFLICAVIMASKIVRGSSQGPFGITIPGVTDTSEQSTCLYRRMSITCTVQHSHRYMQRDCGFL